MIKTLGKKHYTHVLFCSVLQSVTECCTVLQSVATRVLQSITECCNTNNTHIYCFAVCCRVLQSVATLCNTEEDPGYWRPRFWSSSPSAQAQVNKTKQHKILCLKRQDRFSDPFFDLVQNTSLVRFSYLLRLCNFCKAPRDMRKFLQKCQKIAGC